MVFQLQQQQLVERIRIAQAAVVLLLLLVSGATVGKASTAAAAAAADNPSDPPVCHMATSTGFLQGNIGCENTNNNTSRQPENGAAAGTETEEEDEKPGSSNNQEKFEPPDAEWCRRRPTWKNEDGTDAQEFCEDALGYRIPNHLTLVSEDQDYLSSGYDPLTGTHHGDWHDDAVYYRLPVLERPLFRALANCMDTKLEGVVAGPTTGTLERPSLAREYRRHSDGLVMMAIVDNALSEEEVAAVEALTECAKQYVPGIFWRRPFEHTDEGGGNDTTFLSGYLQLLLPGVAARTHRNLRMVWEQVGWGDDPDVTSYEPADWHALCHRRNGDDDDDDDNQEEEEEEDDEELDCGPPTSDYSRRWWPDPMDCGIRTSEHLSYDVWGVLGYHQDSGSDYTVLTAFSDPTSYEGGEFNLCPHSEFVEGIHYRDTKGRRRLSPDSAAKENSGIDCHDKITIKPDRQQAIVFLSVFSHGVSNITSEGRVMFTNEFWRYQDVPVSLQRPGIKEFVLDLNEDDDDLFYEHGDDGDDEENEPLQYFEDEEEHDDDDEEEDEYYEEEDTEHYFEDEENDDYEDDEDEVGDGILEERVD